MASIFDYYGSMRKGMEDREKEKEATILARQDAMYQHLERFPTLDDESIDAYASQFGIGDNFAKAVKKKRDQNVFVQNEKNKQLQQATTTGDLDIISREIANDQADLNFRFSEETFDNKVALSDLDVKLQEVNLDQSIENLKESQFDFTEKRKKSALVFRKLELEVEANEISNEQALETLKQNKLLFPLEMQKIINDVDEGKISVKQALQNLTQDALLFEHTLDSKRLQNISTKEDIINQYREYNYNATEEEVKEFLKILNVNPSRALDIIAYHKTKKDKEDQQLFLNSLETQKKQADTFGDLYQKALQANGYNHEKAVHVVMTQITASGNEDLIKAAELEMAKYNQVEADKEKAKQSLAFISEYIPAGTSMARAKEIMESFGTDPELQKIILQDVQRSLQTNFLQQVATNRGIAEVFLSGNEEDTLSLLRDYGFDVENMTFAEIDVLKNIVYQNNAYKDMKDKSVLETVGNTISNNTKDMANFITATSGDYTQRDLPILQMINQKYYIRPEDIINIVQELKTIDGDGSSAFSAWEQLNGKNYQTQSQFKTSFVSGLKDSNLPMYLDEDNKPVDSTSDDANTTEAGLSSMNNFMTEQISMITNNGELSNIQKRDKLVALQEKLIKDLETMQKNIKDNTTDPDSDKEFELVLNMVASVERVIGNTLETLQDGVAEEKAEQKEEYDQMSFNTTFVNASESYFDEINKAWEDMQSGTITKAGGSKMYYYRTQFDRILKREIEQYYKDNDIKYDMRKLNTDFETVKSHLQTTGNYPNRENID